MAVLLTDEQRAWLTGTLYGHLATLMPDGSPHVAPVWVDADGDHILVNSTESRLKTRNTRRDPRVALSVRRDEDELTVRGRVVSFEHDGADAHIDALAMRYHGRPYDGWTPDMVRVILRIEPDRITGG